VDLAETALIEPEIPDTEDTEVLLDVLTYLGAADTRGFPLTWDILTGLVAQLGGTLNASVNG